MNKLLLAGLSDSVVSGISAAVCDRWEVLTCSDGAQAIAIMERERPDALVIDLGLPVKNGFEVLSERFPDLPPIMIASSVVLTDFVQQRAAQWGVDFLCQNAPDAAFVADCLGSATQLQKLETRRVAQHLRVLGFNAGHHGYYCLLTAIPLLKSDMSQLLNKELYERISSVVDSEPKAVEKAIRTAIGAAWNDRPEGVWEYYFPVGRNGTLNKPTNKGFLMTLALQI